MIHVEGRRIHTSPERTGGLGRIRMTRIARLAPTALAALLMSMLPTPGQAQAKPRHYDCSKAGNANKTVCKGQAAPTPAPAPVPAPAPARMPAERHYDCSKAGNANKTACRGATSATVAPPQAQAPMAPAPTASSRPTVGRPSVAPASVPGGGNPTAKCRDGSLSYSAHRSGTCSRHGGVASWM